MTEQPQIPDPGIPPGPSDPALVPDAANTTVPGGPDTPPPADPPADQPKGGVDPAKAAALNEDWLRAMSWDIRLPDGSPASNLNEVAFALGTDRETAAKRILSEPFGTAAPAKVKSDAQTLVDALGKGEPDPEPDPNALPEPAPAATDPASADPAVPDGTTDAPAADAVADPGDTPDVGSAVTVAGKAAHIDLIVSGGAVPGTETTNVVVPTARVVFADGTKSAIPLALLRAEHPAAATGTAALNGLLTEHTAVHGKSLTPAASVVGEVYRRGIKAAPAGSDPDQWALGRVMGFLAKTAGDSIPGYTRDDDLLPEGHPSRATSRMTYTG